MRIRGTTSVEICILAGGLSSRMGRDKSRVRLGSRTILGHIRAVAGQLNLPILVIRRDAVPRCGPLGGICTGLARSRADAVLFLACDMPFITPSFLNQMIRTFHKRNPPREPAMGRRKPPHPGLLIQGGVGADLVRRAVQERMGGSKASVNATAALFASHNKLISLPCILRRATAHPIASRQITQSQFSLQAFAKVLNAKTIRPSRRPSRQLLNINTRADLRLARQLLQ